MNTNHIYLSLIIPVYNEKQRLIPGLKDITTYLAKQPYTWEIILVDDGSKTPASDDIHAAMKEGELPQLSLKTDFRIVRVRRNAGKGAAIRTGVMESRGQVVVFCDIDLSVPIDTLAFMLKKLKQFPVVIASRRLRDSKIVVHQKRLRELSGRLFTALSNMVCKTHVADVTCGFKGFRRDTAILLFSKQKINRWVFDTEIIFLARKYKLEVRQVAVSWSDKPGSKVRGLDSVRSLIDLFRVRWFSLIGKYD